MCTCIRIKFSTGGTYKVSIDNWQIGLQKDYTVIHENFYFFRLIPMFESYQTNVLANLMSEKWYLNAYFDLQFLYYE